VSGKSRYSSKPHSIAGGKDRGDNHSQKPDQYYHKYLKPKDLCLIPFRVAIAAQEDGWWVRSVIIWSKPNPMPESVHGSHFIRHCVTIEEYEKLSGMRSTKGSNKDGSADLPRMSPSQVSDCEEALSEQSQRTRDREGLRTETRSQREPPSSQPFTASQTEQGKAQTNKRRTEATEERSQSTLLQDSEGQIQEATRLCEAETSNSSRPTSNSRGLARDTESSQEPLSLLPQEESANDRPYNTNQQGGQTYQDEHSASLSELQRQEEGQSGDALIECPGCPKCKRYNGYIRIKGSGRPTESHEYILMLTKSDDYFFDTDAVRREYTEPLNRWGGPTFRDSSHKYIEMGGHDGEQKYGATSMFRKGRPVRPNEGGANIRSVWEFPEEVIGEAQEVEPKEFRYEGQATKDYKSAGAQDPSETKRRILRGLKTKGQQEIGNQEQHHGQDIFPQSGSRNLRSVWHFPTQPFPQAHFAVFPEKLPELCIKAATPEVGCCSKCGAPWERIVEKIPQNVRSHKLAKGKVKDAVDGNNPDMAVGGGFSRTGVQFEWQVNTLGWKPQCKCGKYTCVNCQSVVLYPFPDKKTCPNCGSLDFNFEPADKAPSIVLDPFAGAGTTLWVAKKLNRKAIGFEISEEYCNLAIERCSQQAMGLSL